MELHQYPLRSYKQHKAEWLYYQIISDITGHTPYEVYTIMVKRLLKTIDENGEIAYYKPATLNTYLHNQYMEQIRLISIEFGIILPDIDTSIELNIKLTQLNGK